MLRRKMIRDIRQNLSQFITILLMVFIGIMAYSGIESYMEGMKETANNFYGDYNLQDLNVMGELSEENINTIKEISNVKNAEGKLKVNGVLENDDDTTISMNFIEENEISKFYIVDGENFNKDTKGIWLDNFFAEENNIKLGDILKIKYDGYVFEEKIVGLINVPDHVYDVKDESQLYPDHKTFGFAYASSNELEGFIKNQVMKEENFADKWALEPIKRAAFFKWVNRAQKELATDPMSCYGINTVAEHYKHLLGQAPVERAVNSLGNDVLTARKNGNLYISGLGGGLNVSQQKGDKQVKEHTFFGILELYAHKRMAII